MKKPATFPFEHQASGLVFRVHSAPQTVTLKDGASSAYESFLLQYYDGGRRVQERRNTWEAIDQLIEETVIAHRQKDPERLELTGRDRRIYLAAREAAQPLNREVDQVVQDHAFASSLLLPHGMDVRAGAQTLADALKRLGGRPLSEAIDFFKRHKARDVLGGTVTEIITKLENEAKKDGNGEYHLRDLKNPLGRFAKSFPGPIQPITESQITGWLQGLKKIDRRGRETDFPVGSRTRNNYRDAIAELFAFARKRDYLPRDLPSAGESTSRVKVTASENHIIPPGALLKLLDALPVKLVVPVVLKSFCGLRTEENRPVCWEFLRQESKAIVIPADIAKTGQRRAPPILPNLAKWLRPFRGLEGPINPGYQTPQALHQAIKRCADRVGIRLRRNTFRNCYISYRVAMPYPIALVAQETGTSVKMIESNYKELATAKEAARWFAIAPTAKQLKALRDYADTIRERLRLEKPKQPVTRSTKS